MTTLHETDTTSAILFLEARGGLILATQPTDVVVGIIDDISTPDALKIGHWHPAYAEYTTIDPQQAPTPEETTVSSERLFKVAAPDQLITTLFGKKAVALLQNFTNTVADGAGRMTVDPEKGDFEGHYFNGHHAAALVTMPESTITNETSFGENSLIFTAKAILFASNLLTCATSSRCTHAGFTDDGKLAFICDSGLCLILSPISEKNARPISNKLEPYTYYNTLCYATTLPSPAALLKRIFAAGTTLTKHFNDPLTLSFKERGKFGTITNIQRVEPIPEPITTSARFVTNIDGDSVSDDLKPEGLAIPTNRQFAGTVGPFPYETTIMALDALDDTPCMFHVGWHKLNQKVGQYTLCLHQGNVSYFIAGDPCA